MEALAAVAVGFEVDAWCTRCKEDHMHVVSAKNNGHILKVTCNICSTTHKYHPPHTVASTRRKPPQAERITTHRASKEEPPLPQDDALYRAYDLKDNFRVLDLIRHPKFGRGRVVKLLSREKMEVRFGDGRKLLAQNQGRS
ncbi:MAG: hypothetical protein U0166_21070 [Acidobacteriota bacterium]